MFVPGFWQGISVFDSVSTEPKPVHGYSIMAVPTVSTGTASSGNTTLKDDVCGIRSAIELPVRDEKEPLLVLHSARGVLGVQAMKGLSMKEQVAEGN